MTNYWDDRFLQHLEINNIKIIFEIGARYGDETIKLSNVFTQANIYSFECNPLTINICQQNLSNMKNINFFAFGFGDKEELLPFYSYMISNDGASSLYKRIDYDTTQKMTGCVKINKLNNFVKEQNIDCIDLLCMDVQGYELNILKGSENFIKNIKYIIMEEPNAIINKSELPNNMYSKYIGAPSPMEIKEFMIKNGFIELERIAENKIEDNVLYKNINIL